MVAPMSPYHADQGREFVNRVNAVLFQLTGTEHRISIAYHPQTNGLVERYNQTLQRSLRIKDIYVYCACLMSDTYGDMV